MKKTSTKKDTKRAWVQPLLGSLSLIDITLGSLFAGAAMAEGPEARHLIAVSLILLTLGCLSLWRLGAKPAAQAPLTDHS